LQVFEEAKRSVLLGASGAANATLKLINRLIEPTSGAVRVEGKSTLDWDAINLRRRTATFCRKPDFFPHFTLSATLRSFPNWKNGTRRKKGAREEMLELVGLSPPKIRRTFTRTNYRAVSASGSASRVLWRRIQIFCCSTNRSARSIR
jgi:osmoprotectant transport system ATP-binding protein